MLDLGVCYRLLSSQTRHVSEQMSLALLLVNLACDAIVGCRK